MNPHGAHAVVAGAGVVGCIAALALADAGCEVLLVDSGFPDPVPIVQDGNYDLRVFALSQGSRRLLESLGVWRALPPGRTCAYRRMRIWDEHGSGEIDFDASLIGEEALGYIVEQRALLGAAMTLLQRSVRVEMRNDSVESMTASSTHVSVRLASGVDVRSALVIAADGARSGLRSQAGIAVAEEDYGQQALVAHLRCELAHDAIARQRFVGGGPLALLPLADGRVSLVWSLPEADAKRLLSVDEATFLDAVTAASNGALGRCLETSARAAFPLRRWQATAFSGKRLLLAGDAAHGVHPLAGQGLNLGLQDVSTLRDLVLAARASEADIGGAALLANYARSRQGENAIAGHAFGALHHLFASRSPLLAFARGVGMRLVDRATPLKRLLAEHASGIS